MEPMLRRWRQCRMYQLTSPLWYVRMMHAKWHCTPSSAITRKTAQIISTKNVLSKFNHDWTKYTTLRVLTRPTAPTLTGTIFELGLDHNLTNLKLAINPDKNCARTDRQTHTRTDEAVTICCPQNNFLGSIKSSAPKNLPILCTQTFLYVW
ncbi:hypothetical protein DPMN_056092 [Dreissena polymorpha]|uniref:Uncharacterized protein n=1 Tax=Dreissena polymorpha TaxID=45954 RepID=A0A9D4CRX0_DREPO|nr:hypothetical protein DPMN_056092 [Dreissena polymorpha]